MILLLEYSYISPNPLIVMCAGTEFDRFCANSTVLTEKNSYVSSTCFCNSKFTWAYFESVCYFPV
jgi:hypothetical protein